MERGVVMNIYVGNLDREVTEDELHEMFAEFGQVKSTQLIKDKFTGQSRGFAFVEMDEKKEADAAIAALNGKMFKGRALTVNEARPKEPAGSRGGGGSRRGGKEW
jgi:RNA recognition motif-containing protein